MATEKQVAANRRNAAKSTGPKTAEGKQVTRLNALKHGLQAEHVVIPGEDPEEFEALFRSLEEHYQPVGTVEGRLVERAAHSTWRLQRLSVIETGIMRWEHFWLEGQRAKDEMERASKEMDRHRPAGDGDWDDWLDGEYEQSEEPDESDVPEKHDQVEESEETDESYVPEEYAKALRAYENAEEAHAKAEDELAGSLCNLASVFRGSWDLLEKLSRYETTLERRLRNAMQDLERLQAARKAEAAASATVIEISDVS